MKKSHVKNSIPGEGRTIEAPYGGTENRRHTKEEGTSYYSRNDFHDLSEIEIGLAATNGISKKDLKKKYLQFA